MLRNKESGLRWCAAFPSRARVMALILGSVAGCGSDVAIESVGQQLIGPTIVLNEAESSGGVPGDWVELYNPEADPIDISGYVFRDNDDAHAYAIPAGTVVEAGAYYVIDEAMFGFGLGGSDAVRLFSPDGMQVDSYVWSAHATSRYGRCPNGSNAFTGTTAITKGAANDCGPQVTLPDWPGQQAVTTVDNLNQFGTNVSDLFYQSGATNVLWAVRNGPSMLYKLIQSGSLWTDDVAWSGGKALRFPNGTGDPDAEAVTMAEMDSTISRVGKDDVRGLFMLARVPWMMSSRSERAQLASTGSVRADRNGECRQGHGQKSETPLVQDGRDSLNPGPLGFLAGDTGRVRAAQHDDDVADGPEQQHGAHGNGRGGDEAQANRLAVDGIADRGDDDDDAGGQDGIHPKPAQDKGRVECAHGVPLVLVRWG